MRLTDLNLSALRFRASADVFGELQAACESNPDLARFEVIGTSEEGRPIAGVTLGYGPQTVTLVAGAHADEPVGPETLRTLVLEGLAARDWLAEGEGLHALFEQFTFKIVPHVNPDAEAKNQAWIKRWPNLGAYLIHRLREPPGRDVEFGYPVMRPENRAVSRFLFDYQPIALHMSLHGMGFAEGALLLIEERWADRTEALQSGYAEATQAVGLRLHDQDRSGDKGFRYLGPGFWTTPKGTAMRAYFRRQGDPETGEQFFLSSMELAVLSGRDPRTGQTPLSLVTELPLFVLTAEYNHKPGVPLLFDRLREDLPALTLAAQRGDELDKLIEPYTIDPLDLTTAVRLHLRVIELGLEAVSTKE
ncbi:MAG: peptidase M14 [Rhodothermaceae bacterium]|nr:peptidase M14 [Rhodothermaceae bacterium]